MGRRVLFSRWIATGLSVTFVDMSKLDAATTGQVTATAAETYETFFVPALFGQWPDRVLDVAGLSAGDDVLDVGCGTGIVARAAARRLDGTGSVTGVDINDGMLTVARRACEPVTWQLGPAEELPFAARSFDRVVSQFALMFFADQTAAVAEMARVVRPGGTVTVVTWAGIEQSPGYAAMVGLLEQTLRRRHRCGPERAVHTWDRGTADARAQRRSTRRGRPSPRRRCPV